MHPAISPDPAVSTVENYELRQDRDTGEMIRRTSRSWWPATTSYPGWRIGDLR